jgi:hypothetical protein
MRAAPARATTDKKAPLRCGTNAQALVRSSKMPKKRNAPRAAAEDEASSSDSDAPLSAAPLEAFEPRRNARNAHLYNADLFGLNPQLDHRTRLIISCYVMSNIAPAVVRAAFQTAHVYPRSAVEELKRGVSVRDGGLASRKSNRLEQDSAVSQIQELGKNAATMSNREVICKAHAIVKSVLDSDQYALRPMEELAPGRRRKKDATAVPKAAIPKHKQVLGLFQPDDSQAIADSFTQTQRFFEATHLFVCDECPRRFASWHYLKKHCNSTHQAGIPDTPLTPEQEAVRLEMMRLQREAKDSGIGASAAAVRENLNDDVAAACDFDDDQGGDVVFRDLFVCLMEQECKNVVYFTMDELCQHIWEEHPHFMFGDGASFRNQTTNEEFMPDPGYEPMEECLVEFLKQALPANTVDWLDDEPDETMAWLIWEGFVSQPAANRSPPCRSLCSDNLSQAVEQYNLQFAGFRAGREKRAGAKVVVAKVAAAERQVAAAASVKGKPRTCKICKKAMKGHKKSACRPPTVILSLSPSARRGPSHSPSKYVTPNKGTSTPSTQGRSTPSTQGQPSSPFT